MRIPTLWQAGLTVLNGLLARIPKPDKYWRESAMQANERKKWQGSKGLRACYDSSLRPDDFKGRINPSFRKNSFPVLARRPCLVILSPALSYPSSPVSGQDTCVAFRVMIFFLKKDHQTNSQPGDITMIKGDGRVFQNSSRPFSPCILL